MLFGMARASTTYCDRTASSNRAQQAHSEDCSSVVCKPGRKIGDNEKHAADLQQADPAEGIG
jgi:hypothetical protein